MCDDNDPNWLAIVLCALHEIDDRRRDLLPAVEGRPSSKSGIPTVLDSFARLLIDAETQKDQATAVAFRPTTSAAHPATFVLAQTAGVTDDVVHHILYLVAHLRRVRGLYLQEAPGPDAGSAVLRVTFENTPLQKELQLGEMRALHHCWAKIKQRVTKDSRDERFVRLVADVLDGEPADERAGCDGEEKRTLKALQACSPADRERLREVGKSIAAVAGLLKHECGRLEGEPGEYEIPDADVQPLLKLRLYNHLMVRLMREGRHLWPLCTDYIRVRCPSEEAEGEQNATKQAAMRPFNVAQWLSKIVSVTLDYLGLRSAAVSSTVAGALFDDRDCPPTVSRAPNQRAPAKTAEVISEAQLKAILVKVGWDDVKEAEYAEVVDNLRRIVNNKPADASAASVQSVDGSFVHCECALLSHLHDQGIEDTIAYIGVSKPSCELCATYFACYREATGSGITTRGTGTHGRLVQWQMPSLNDSRLDATLRAKMCEKLTEKLKAQAAEVRKQHRKSSQSNVASLPGMKELAPVPGFAAVEGSSIDVAISIYYM